MCTQSNLVLFLAAGRVASTMLVVNRKFELNFKVVFAIGDGQV